MVHLEEQLVPVTPKPNVEKLETGIITSGKATRVVEIYNEDESECITIGASGSTRTPEVREIVSSFTKIDAEKIQLISKVGVFPVKQRLSDEVASKVVALGVRSFARAHQKYDHTIVVIGAGLGGMQTMLSLIQGGRKDIVCLDRLSAFGGHSWLVVSNKYTKLQTESGNYHVDYLLPDAPATSEVEGEPYKSWPTRDQLLKMFREGAKRHSLSNFTKFNTNVEKVRPLPDGSGYSVHTSPANGEGEGELIVASAVLAWPGNLCNYRELEWPGEEDFGGYIAYASFSKVDYREAEGKVCILYGHGAFTIENAMKLSTPVMWPDHQVLFALIGGKDNFRSHLPAANKTTAILFVKEMTHMPQQHLTKEVDDGIAKGRLKPLEEVVHLDEGEEVPLHSHQDREKLRRSSKGKGKGKGGKDGKGKGKGKEPQGKQDAGVRERMDKYLRSSAGTKAELKVTGDKKLQTQAKRRQRNDREAAFRLAKAEVLQTAEAGVIEAEDEDTTRLTQQEILESVGVGVARKYFNFDLPYGPYNCSLSRNGAHLLVGGRKGHVAFMHLESMKIFSELHVKETVRAVQTLHNENLYAVAQK